MLHADLVAFNGNLITLDAATPAASALAVRDGKIAFVGPDADALRLAGPDTERVDLRGRTVTPGFCDAHLHLFWYGTQLLRQADLVGSDSIEDVLARLSAHANTYPGPWIQGHGFDQDKLREGRFPTRQDLDRVSSTRPLIISRICGHAAVVNSAALALVTDQERARGDEETGLYTEADVKAFYRYIPPLTDDEAEEAVLRAAQIALATGITSIGTLLDTPDQMRAYFGLNRRGKLPLRVTGMPPQASITELWERGVGTTFGNNRLKFGGAKLFSDGSLGARTALLSAPYADEDRPDNMGIRIYPPDELKQRARDAQEHGFQVVIHAIGDQAVTESVDALLHALGPDGDNTFHRHRIEHASILSPRDLQRMAQRKIVAVVQPQFVTSDTWTGERVGDAKREWAYPFRQMWDAGIPLALSSDCPVESLDALKCLAATVFRHPWSPDETLTIDEALHAYCLGGAYALHQDDTLGSLTPGKHADFVILSGNPREQDEAGLRALRAEAVYVGGTCAAGEASPAG